MALDFERLRDALKAALDLRFGSGSGDDDDNRKDAMEDIAKAICDEVTNHFSGGGGGGAPTDATYITASSNATLSAELVLGTHVIMKGALSSRPAAAVEGTLYFVTDSGEERLQRDTGSAWEDLTLDWSYVVNAAITNSQVSGSAAIVESKLALNYATHSNANDPSSGQKDALAGTSGTPSSGNKYVTDGDSRNTNARTPSAHAASHAAAGSDPLTLSESQITNLISDLSTLASGVSASALASTTISTTAPLSGGGSLAANRTLTLLDDGVTDAKLRNSAALSVIGNATNGSTDPADIVAASDGGVLRRSGTGIGFGPIPESSVTDLTTDLAARAKLSNVQVFTGAGSYTWTKPTGAKTVKVRVIGSGGGGGSGRKSSTAVNVGGGGGGGGGGISEEEFDASFLGATEAITIGTAGTGGAAQASNASNGNPGTAGNDCSFGSWLTGKGGALGGAGTTGSGGGGNGGLGSRYGSATPGQDGGNGGLTSNATSQPVTSTGLGGGRGGGGGAGRATTTRLNGADGGAFDTTKTIVKGAKGTSGTPGSDGGNGSPDATYNAGAGGGGGGSDGGKGGNGGLYGGGGGGGAGGTNDVTDSGKGGDGALGCVIVTTYF